MLQDKITQYTAVIKAFAPSSAQDVEAFRLNFLVSKGIVKNLFEEFNSVSSDEKRVVGKVLNEFKQLAENTFKEASEQFADQSEGQSANPEGDLTLPGPGFTLGSRHPLSLVRKEIVDIFKKLGFVVAEGNE